MKNILKLKNLYILIAVLSLGYGGYYFGTQNTEISSSSKTLELTTTAIQKGDLAKKEEYNGTLRQTDSRVLNSPMSGVVTFVPKEGTIVNFGEVLFAVDNKPVILVEGATPFYRTLDLNSDAGPDVLQLEQALVFLGYAVEDFVPDETFDETTSNMLNALYVDYKIDTKSEITPAEQVAINLKKTEVDNIEETISDGGTTLVQVNDKKKKLDDAKEASTEESTAWKAADTAIENAEESLTLYRDETNPKTKEKKADGTLDAAIEDLEQTIEEQKRIKALEKGKESGVDATEALAIETAQKAYDDALKNYNEGVDQAADATDPVSNCGHWPAPGFPIPTPAAGDSSGANANPAAAAASHGGGDDPDDPTPPREEPPHPATRPAPLGSDVQKATDQDHWAASRSANGLNAAFAKGLATSPAPHGPRAAKTPQAAGAPTDPSIAQAAPLG